jgi:hypothetical protein
MPGGSEYNTITWTIQYNYMNFLKLHYNKNAQSE